MGYLLALIIIVVAVGLILMTAFKRVSKKEPELDPDAAGTSYEKPQDEGPV
jgi:hypothetical protein